MEITPHGAHGHMARHMRQCSRMCTKSRVNHMSDKFMLSNTTLTTKPPLMGLHVAYISSSPSNPLLDPFVREGAWSWWT